MFAHLKTTKLRAKLFASVAHHYNPFAQPQQKFLTSLVRSFNTFGEEIVLQCGSFSRTSSWFFCVALSFCCKSIYFPQHISPGFCSKVKETIKIFEKKWRQKKWKRKRRKKTDLLDFIYDPCQYQLPIKFMNLCPNQLKKEEKEEKKKREESMKMKQKRIRKRTISLRKKNPSCPCTLWYQGERFQMTRSK